MTRRSGLLLALPLLLAAAAPAHAAPEMSLLRLEMDRAADAFRGWLADRPVRVEPFTCLDPVPANGRILTHLFTEALRRRGAAVRPNAAVTLRGRFRDAGEPGAPLACLKILLQGSDTAGGRKSLEISVHAPSVLALLFGRPGALGARPAMVHTIDGEIFARAGSPFTLSIRKAADPHQVLGEKDYTRLTRCWVKDGLAHAELKRGDVYGVLLFNRSDHDVAVRLSLDGLDTFAHRPPGGEAAADGRFHILRKGQSTFVRYWQDGATDASHVFRLGERTPRGPGGVGFITAQYFRCWPRTDAEGATERVEDRPAAKKAGRPPRVISYTVGPLLETIPVRYAREPD